MADPLRKPDADGYESGSSSDSGVDSKFSAWEADNPHRQTDPALLELLKKLEKEEAMNQRSALDGPAQEDNSSSEPEIVCSACRWSNPPNQRFCGFCGGLLQVDRLNPEASQPFSPQVRTVPRKPPASAQPPVKPAAPTAPAPPAAPHGDDPEAPLQFLRYKTFSVSTEEESSGRLKFAIVVLLLVSAGLLGYRWYTRRAAVSTARPAATEPATAPAQPETPPQAQAGSTSQNAPQSAPAQTATTAPAEAQKQAARKPAETQPETQPPVKSAQAEGQKGAPPTRSASNKERLPVAASLTSRDSTAANGAEEMNQAVRYLSGGNRDTRAAARLLWKAVGKENGRASVLLADLYARGDGVAKNCDQAQLLLMAAAKKGVPDSASKLRFLRTTGCK